MTAATPDDVHAGRESSRARAFIGIGSNLDDPVSQVIAAIGALAACAEFELIGRSRLYRSPPFGPIAQPDFINAVVEVETGLDAHDTLRALKQLETDLGRQQGDRWGPRRIDLDLLTHGDNEFNADEPGGPGAASLHLPHPGIPDRAFVLLPLAELSPRFVVPGLGPVAELLAAMPAASVAMVTPIRTGDGGNWGDA